MIQDSYTPMLLDTHEGWYCVRAQPKREHIAAGQLSRLSGVEVFCPRIRFRRNTKRGKVWFEEALFPGYLFARFDLQPLFRAVSASVGVSGLVRFGGEVARVPDFLIDRLRDDSSGVIVVQPSGLRVGDQAVLAEGAMCGLPALITRVLPGGERVKILMELMGTIVEAEVSMGALEPAA
jgi:transcriptional antiterminator RfaH